MTDRLGEEALDYHRLAPAGKLAVVATKPLATQRDLSLAYSPGVAAACELIAADPLTAAEVTARGNLVAVVTNGTAVLGLGAIGALASKPVMEGKAVLFKKFAGIDSFDIEIEERDPDKLVEIVASLEPTFGAINLEDIRAPECFIVESKLRERMKIPVFHDDQHGTAIIVAAAVRNGLFLMGKPIEEARLVASGAGAASLACLNLLVGLGMKLENILVTDIDGVVYEGRPTLMDPWKAKYARPTGLRTLAEAIDGADIFLGLSAAGVLKPDMVARMAPKPLILALANPTPEILPELAKEVRPDAIIATGRSDYPNQVNNVLCFPFIFRGALDVGATTINEEMKLACVDALARLARVPPPETVTAAYGVDELRFGPDYLIPKPFDTRLIVELPPAVAKAAMDTGVATRPLADPAAYRQRLSQRVIRSGLMMKPIFEAAGGNPQRLVYTDGEEERVLRAVQVVVEERLAKPILIGRPEVIDARVEKLGPRPAAGPGLRAGQPGQRPALQRLCRVLPRAGRPQGRHAPDRARGAADPSDRDRDRDAGPRRGRRDAGRPGRPLLGPSAPHRRRDRAAATDERGLRRPRPGARRRGTVHRRHQRQLRAQRRPDRRDRDPGRGAGARLRARAQGRPDQPQQFRQPRHALVPEDARGAGHPPPHRTGAGGRRRDAGRHRPLARGPRAPAARLRR